MAATKVIVNFDADVRADDLAAIEALVGGFPATTMLQVRTTGAGVEKVVRRIEYDAAGDSGNGTLVIREDAV